MGIPLFFDAFSAFLAEKKGVSKGTVIKLIELLNSKKFLTKSNVAELPSFDINESLNLWIHSTDECNLQCSYCYIQTKTSKKHFEEKVFTQFHLKVLELVKNGKLKQLTLRLAGGEPFIRFNRWKTFLLDLKHTIAKYDCEFNITYLTNLTILNDEIISFIKSEKVGIGVSLDGLKEYHDHSRSFKNGKGSFDLVFNNLNRLFSENIHPTIMSVISNNNIDGLLDFTKFLVKQKLRFRYSIVQDDNFDYEKAFKVFSELYYYIEKQIEDGYAFSKYHQLCDLNFKNIFYQACGAGINSGALYTDGRIYFCQQQVGTENYSGSIFSNEDLVSIISKGNHYNGELNNECKACRYRYICSNGCPLNRINGKDHSCNFYKEFIPVVYRLLGKERLFNIKERIKHETLTKAHT